MLRLYNTLTRRVEPFVPIRAGKAGMYTCGPTVYREVHLGNLRSYLLADWLRRALTVVEGLEVTHVKNITDVGHMRRELLDRGEDKMIAAALAEGKAPLEIAERYAELFLRDEARLGILAAQVFPRATAHVPDMVALTERLLASGNAYEVDGAVYFSVRSFAPYGALSGNVQETLRAGMRAEVDPAKRDPSDFALWKRAEPGRVLSWPSPWGRGFPGWHIECSAMSTRYLGEHFDLHSGGVDNIFPHHEDEIAQSEAAFGAPFVRHWVHGQHLLADGVKMAKSAGNTYTLDDLAQSGIDPLAFRYLCLLAHYRTRMNFTFGGLRQAAEALDHLRQRLRVYAQLGGDGAADSEPWRARFRERVRDDLDLPGALAALQAAHASDLSPAAKLSFSLECDAILGLRLSDVVREKDELDLGQRNRVVAHAALRARGDHRRSDEMRAVDGHVVEDHLQGVVVARRDRRLPRRPRATIGSARQLVATRDPAVEWTVAILSRDWWSDLERCLTSVLAALPGSAEVLVLDDGSTNELASRGLESLARRDPRVRAIFADRPLGEGAARDGLRRIARGRLQLHLDPSVELDGDLFTVLRDALAGEGVGLAGPWGLVTSDLRTFEERTSGVVDAVQGYCLAARSEILARAGGFDGRYRFYRNLDVALSFAVREEGLSNVAVGADRVRRYAHRGWEALGVDEREKRSRKNFDRFLRRFGERRDLLVAVR